MIFQKNTSKCAVVVFVSICLLFLLTERLVLNKAKEEVEWYDVPMKNSSLDFQETECLPGGVPASLSKLRMLYDDVETFVMFIGYPRSSHSLLGSILDAHPAVIIPHEYHIVERWEIYKDEMIRNSGLLKYLLFYNLHSLSTWQATFGSRAEKPVFLNDGINSYNVPGSWQGTYNGKLKVIGDKKGGGTTMELCEKPEKFAVLKEFKESLDIPLKFLHVVRNPYDVISTWLLRLFNARLKVKDGKTKVKNTKALDHFIKSFFELVETNEKIRQIYGRNSVLDILSHELLSKHPETMQKICAFINISCSENYLQQVKKIFFEKPSKTRTTVEWTAEQKEIVRKEMQKYPYLQSFDFEGEY